VSTPVFDVDALLADRSRNVIVCCGSGGVGKTTTAAALAVRAADHGRRVVVLTIDPARRLAQAMGLHELDNAARRVAGVGGVDGTIGKDGHDGGLLDAAMLDMKSTFDELIVNHARPDKAQQILANPVYQTLSSSFAGTQEYMAMERLGQLLAEAESTGSHDLIIVDTPPSRSALDFLDAPDRLASFLDGRFVRLLAAPTRGPLRLLTAGFSAVTGTLTKLLGSQLLADVSSLAAALDTVFGGFRARAERTYAVLQRPSTGFVVVATPDRDALREASYFTRRLAEEQMPLVGLVLNRMATSFAPLDLDRTRITLAGLPESFSDADGAGDGPASEPVGLDLTRRLLQLHAEHSTVRDAQQAHADRFAAAHLDLPTAFVPGLPSDVHDLDGLRLVGAALAGDTLMTSV
jgi:anion-transporting  ArsA/GET3 family ATPase